MIFANFFLYFFKSEVLSPLENRSIYRYELSNGIIHYETGDLWTDNHDRAQDIVEGTYWFVGPDNTTYKIEYFVIQDDFEPNIGDGSGVNFNVLKSAVG